MDYWNERKARWYSEALKISDYAEKVLGVMEGKIRPEDTVLDIGAGCGA
ncbi:MAG: class I SAM-dependent methyltransferase, partial [Anaerolineae bacterium]|nr:class I SAM-dependent methyltransferase [Anaerolineae bacterium]NIN97713.1 class I SAM-dependent methyltransferase [Anaerolineae bacterium]NIQ80700.1 class I SAM-dependent methyltransferase [Anaerolineae bacterium]